MLRRTSATLLLVALVLLAEGCTGEKPREPAPVRGKILRDKKPVAGILVRFHPKDAGAVADALTKADGSFELSCLPGKYDISLMPLPHRGGAGGDAADAAAIKTPDKVATSKAGLPPRYLEPTLSPWRDIDIPAAGRDDLELLILD